MLILAILFIALQLAYGQADIQLQLNTSLEKQRIDNGQANYYTLNITDQPNSSYLIFDLSSTDDEDCDPDIFISSSTPRPTVRNTEWKCAAYGHDICVIPKEKVTFGALFYATVYSPKKCIFNLKGYLKPEYELTEGVKVTDNLNPSEARIFRFYVPDSIDIKSINVDLQIGTFNSSMVRMFVTREVDSTTQPSAQNTARVIPTWLGLGVRITASDIRDFCKGCHYKVLVHSFVESMYSLEFRTNKGVKILKDSYVDTYDVVPRDEKNCYEYNVSFPDNDLDILISAFSGNPNIYANPLTIPNNLRDFAFSSSGDYDDQLTITPEARKAKNAQSGKYYICIHARQPSSYSLLIYQAGSQDNEIPKLRTGVTRSMNVGLNQLIVFEYEVEESRDANISYTLSSTTGNADLYIKFCKYTLNQFGLRVNDCLLTTRDLDSKDVLKSTQFSSIDSIVTTLHENDCKGENVGCSYYVGVFGVTDAHFSLTVLDESQVFIPLKEGDPFFGYVGLKQSVNFTFTIDDPNTKKVKVTLSSLSGDADFSISRFESECSCFKQISASRKDAYLTDSVTLEKGAESFLNTSYLVKVDGFTFAAFTLTYTTDSNSSSSSGPANIIQLYDGRLHQGSISESNDFMLFKFDYEANATSITPIRVTLAQLSGSFSVFIGADYIPTSTNYTWQFANHESSIMIQPRDFGYRMEGRYYIAVYKFDPTIPNVHIFNIKFDTGRYPNVIVEGNPEFGNVTRGDSVYYMFLVTVSTGIINVTLTPYSGDPDLFISVNASNPIPSDSEYDYVSAEIGADKISVPIEELHTANPACRYPTFRATVCAIYIAVICRSEKCEYTLQVSQAKSRAKKLMEGYPQFDIVSEVPQHYIFMSNSTEGDIVISARLKTGKIKLYINSRCGTSGSSVDPTNFPEPNRADIISTNRANSEVVTIKATASLINCVYYIAVYHDMTLASSPRSEYTITATGEHLRLIDGQTITDFVPDKEYNYYIFMVPCKDCVLTISLTPISSGDPDLFVNKGLNPLPNVDSAHFKATNFRGDFLQISAENEFFTNQGMKSIHGEYTIGVLGYSNCTYSLTATTTQSVVQELTQGIPVRNEQGANKIKYYVFYAWKNENILVRLSMHSGLASIRANHWKNGEVSLMSRLPILEKNATWSSIKARTNNYLQIKVTDPGYVEYGAFLIAVESKLDSSYDIELEYSSATPTPSGNEVIFMTLAESYRLHMNRDETKQIAFIINSRNDLKLSLNQFFGKAEATLHNQQNGLAIGTFNHDNPLIFAKTNPNFIIGTYYITLKASEESDLSVLVEYDVDTVWLSEGLPVNVQTGRIFQKYFAYSIPKYLLEKVDDAKININVKPHRSGVFPIVYVKFTNAKERSTPTPLGMDYTFPWDYSSDHLSATVSVKDKSKNVLSILVVSHVTDGPVTMDIISFDIVIWSSGVMLMQPDHHYNNALKSYDEINIYELSTSDVKKMYIEVTPCVGEVEFFVTKSISDIYDRRYDLKTSELSKGRLYGSVTALQGTYYISVRAVTLSEATNDTRYMIRTILSEKESANDLEDDYKLNNFGRIEYSFEGSKLQLTWGKVLKRTAGSVVGTSMYEEDPSVVYYVYLAEDSKTNMVTTCGVRFGNTQLIGKNLTKNSFSFDFRPKSRSNQIQINVIASISNQTQVVAYNPIAIQVMMPGKFRFVGFALIAVILGLAGLAIYFYCKLHKVQKQLQVEMSDVRNMASISSTKEVESNKIGMYTGLKAQDLE